MTVSGQDVKDQIRKLVLLQNVDEEAFRLKRELREKPAEVETLREAFESKKIALKQLEDKLKKVQLTQKDCEGELKVKEEAIAKADSSLSLLKTNKEYTARLLEIENLKADKSIVEEKILLGYDEVESARKALESEKEIVAKYEQEFNAKKKEVDDQVAIMTDQVKVKESQRERLTPDIKPDILSRYNRILNNKDGLAIVKVENQSCGGCYMHLTEQLVNELRKYDQLVTCDQCARILYLADEL